MTHLAATVCTPWINYDELQAWANAHGHDGSALDAVAAAEAIAVSCDWLYAWSGRQYPGECSVDDLRPCARRVGVWPTSGFPTFAMWPWGSWTDWWHASWGQCFCASDLCSCTSPAKIRLGAFPILDITEVRIDADIVDPGAYRIGDDLWLVRVDGDVWPCYQDWTAEVGEPGAFAVSFTYGANPPPSGVLANKALAWELYRIIIPAAGDCGPVGQRVEALTAQGVSLQLVNPADVFGPNGTTGNELVDRFLSVANPNRLFTPPTILSPDAGPAAMELRPPGTS